MPTFKRLNIGWNAEPNAPDLQLEQDGNALLAKFRPNPYIYLEYRGISAIIIRFENCSKFRVTDVNDHGWFGGQCRFSGLAPSWGEFYEVSGNTYDDMDATPWIKIHGNGSRHFHFYFRDEALEVKAHDWTMQVSS